MLEKLVTLSIFLSLLIAPVPALSDNGEDNTLTKERVQERVGVRHDRTASTTDAIKDRLEENRVRLEKRRARLTDASQERVRMFFARMFNRLESALVRIDKLIDRTESRIEKLEEVNKNISTDEAKKHLEDARARIDTGYALLAGLNTDVENLVVAEDSHREKYAFLKELVADVVEEIRASHKSLVEAVKSIRAQVGHADRDGDGDSDTDDNSDTATSTDQIVE